MNAYRLAENSGYLYKDEVSFLMHLVSGLPTNCVIVNIGAGAGTSALTMLSVRVDSYLYSVDIQAGDSPYGSLSVERKNVLGFGSLHMYERLVQVNSDSAEFGREWKTHKSVREDDRERLHMVFVDGNHSYEGCKADIEAWLPNLVEGGIIAVHDYEKHKLDDPVQKIKGWGGVDKAVDELLLGMHRFVGGADSIVAFRKGGAGGHSPPL